VYDRDYSIDRGVCDEKGEKQYTIVKRLTHANYSFLKLSNHTKIASV